MAGVYGFHGIYKVQSPAFASTHGASAIEITFDKNIGVTIEFTCAASGIPSSVVALSTAQGTNMLKYKTIIDGQTIYARADENHLYVCGNFGKYGNDTVRIIQGSVTSVKVVSGLPTDVTWIKSDN